MFVGALCHDLDHRGFNNKFMIDIGSPLAAIYSTSTMENHHFNMAIIILQQVRWLHESSMPEMITQWLRCHKYLHSNSYIFSLAQVFKMS